MKARKEILLTYIIFTLITPKLSIGASGTTYGQCSSNPNLLCISDEDCPVGDTCIGGGGGSTICTILNCASTSWESTQYYGYETRQYKYCSSRYKCTSETQYRCMQRFYGSPTSLGKGCTLCPSSNGVQGLSAAGSTDITSCYILSNTEISDTTGTYLYTSDCYYTK